jgi:LCP family protein required for cell wall assembly
MSFAVRRISEQRQRSHWKRRLARALAFARPLVQLFARAKRKHDEGKRRAWHRLLVERTAIAAIALLCTLLLLGGIAKALLALHMFSASKILTAAGAELPVDTNGMANILLLGQGGSEHDGVDLTDSIIVASIDAAETKSVLLLSLPRDLYFLSKNDGGKGRVNSIYRDEKYALQRKGWDASPASQEAMRILAKEIGGHLSLPLSHVVKVDFEGFAEGIDAVGGVDIDVPIDIVDTEYPGPNYTYETFSINKGPQTLDGATALKYVRSRHSTSDFDRSARQQQVITALVEKVKHEGLLRQSQNISNLLQIIGEHMETTMSLRELIGLAGLGSGIDRSRILSMQLNDRNGLYGTLPEPGGLLYAPPRDLFGGASVLLPVSVPEFPVTWKQIQALTLLLSKHRSFFLAKPKIAILNAGAASGIARKLGNELTRFGLRVEHVENAGIASLEHSQISSREGFSDHAALLAKLLSLSTLPLPTDVEPTRTRDLTVILGKDYRFLPVQDLLPSLAAP